MSSTADPLAAQAHARAMAGTAAEAMPVVPPRAAWLGLYTNLLDMAALAIPAGFAPIALALACC